MANWYRHGWPGGQQRADDRLIPEETEGASGLAIIVLQQILAGSRDRRCTVEPAAPVVNIYIHEELMDRFLAGRTDLLVQSRGIIRHMTDNKHGNLD